MEIVDNLLWFSGYSIYLTDWCKIYLSIRLHSPKGLEKVDLARLYRDALLVWYAHHQRHLETIPTPPRYYHLELAFEYLKSYQYPADQRLKEPLPLPSRFQQQDKSFKGTMLSFFKMLTSSR
jgi:hypothetical protein